MILADLLTEEGLAGSVWVAIITVTGCGWQDSVLVNVSRWPGHTSDTDGSEALQLFSIKNNIEVTPVF